jgi:hypothetical protein
MIHLDEDITSDVRELEQGLREAEARVERQQVILHRLPRAGEITGLAEGVLADLESSLEACRARHVRLVSRL